MKSGDLILSGIVGTGYVLAGLCAWRAFANFPGVRSAGYALAALALAGASTAIYTGVRS